MAVYADLAWDGNEWTTGRDGSAVMTLHLLSDDPANDTEADFEAAAYAGSPASYRNFLRKSVVLRQIGVNAFLARVNYGLFSQPDTSITPSASSAEFSFDITSQNTKVTSSLAVQGDFVASGKTIPDNGTLIGVQPDGTLEGAEIPQMAYSFSETHYFAPAAITTAYKVALAGLVGTVNYGAPFRGFAAGEVLSTGVSGSRRGAELWQLRFAWAVLPNVNGLNVGDVTGIAKKGWDFIEWFTEESVTATHVERKAIGARVHRVLREGVYANFGIGS